MYNKKSSNKQGGKTCMIRIRLAKTSDLENIMSWNLDGEEFLIQWSNYKYPLTRNQLIERVNSDDYIIFSIEEDLCLVGTVQIFKVDYKTRHARVGCFLMDPDYRKKGIGAAAMKLVIDYAFITMNLNAVELGVFDFNISAIKCYEKCGFMKSGTFLHPFGWTGYHMIKERWRDSC